MKTTLPTLLAQAFLLAALTGATATAQPSPALSYLRSHAADFGLTETDLNAAEVTGSYTDAHNGVTHTYLRQRLNGREILGSELGLHFDSAGRLVVSNGRFVANVQQRAAQAAPPVLSAAEAGGIARQHLKLPGASQPQAPAPVYVRRPDGSLQPAWRVAVRPATGPDNWDVLVDAVSGRVLKASNRTIHEPARLFGTGAAGPALPARTPGTRRPAAMNAYRVWAAPLESAMHGPSSLAQSPADVLASPYGWHDTNGAAGAEFTNTRGNNAYAYALLPGTGTEFSPDGGSNLEFDFPFDPAQPIPANYPASLTNLFYWTNLMHDVSFRYGFTEASGNYQQRNYSGQGLGNDPVKAEANNSYNDAYFAEAPEGFAPTLYVSTWEMPVSNLLTVTAPAAVAGSCPGMPAQFGRALSRTTPLSGQLVLANDGTPRPTQACMSPLANAAQIRGNIAVIDLSDYCLPTYQLQNAQSAGARAVVLVSSINAVYHLQYSPQDTIGLRIPLVMIGQADGLRIKAALQASQPVSVTLQGGPQTPDRTGSLDNGTVAHEYGHGISLRLTGGPAGSGNCLGNAEQMGEGWSDFFALWMSTRPGDTGATPRSSGTYLLGQPTSGPGIRPMPYSTSLAVNNATYAFIGTTVNHTNYGADSYGFPYAHNIGFVWCSVLWDLNWALIQRYGYDANLHSGQGGNNKAMQLVMDGLKLQPCQPGFLDARDAILAADRATFGGANQALIWGVFARRGMGANAMQGSSDVLTDNTAGFQLPAALAARAALEPAALDLYPNPARSQVTLRLVQAHPVKVELLTPLGQPVRSITVSAAGAAAGAALDLSGLSQGLYLLRLSTPEGRWSRRLQVQP